MVRREGAKAKNGLRLVITAAVARQLADWDWVEIALLEGDMPFVTRLRRAGAVTTVTSFALPVRARGALRAGVEVAFKITRLDPLRAGELVAADGLDWGAVVPDNACAVAAGDDLAVHTRHEAPFFLRRVTAWEPTLWLLGVFQAEGTKGPTTRDWTMANKSPALLRAVVDALGAVGIPPARCYLEVLHAPGQTADEASAIYDCVGVPITSVRPRIGKGYHAGLLHVRNSMPLFRMTAAVLAQVLDGDLLERIPAAAARAYALGFLDGDGTLTLERSGIALRVFGAERELRVAACAISLGFATVRKDRVFTDASSGLRWTITAVEATEIALAGAFRFSSSRARLLFGLQRQTRGLRMLHGRFGDRLFDYAQAQAIGATKGHVNGLRLWGYLRLEEASGRLRVTERGRDLAERVALLDEETAQIAKRVDPTTMGIVGKKGL